MAQALCLLHANCQGDALRPLLENSPAFASRFRIRQYVNYTRQNIAAQDIEHCDLFLYQRLAPKWGDLSTEQMLPRLPQHCQAIEIPNLFFKGYWPFWSRDERINFADSLLETLLEKVSPHEAMTLYLRGSAALLGDAAALNRQAEESLCREEAKEADGPIQCASLLRERWREEQMFITVNHPGRELVCHMADSLLRLLGLGGLPQSVRSGFVHPLEDFWLPVHPAVGRSLGLPFASAEKRWPVYHLQLTHREYTMCYMACRANNVSDFLTFLKNLSPDALTTAAAAISGARQQPPTV